MAKLVLQFGQVHRATLHPDGEPESDTTHTLMLMMMAVTLAKTFERGIDLELVMTMALVHDLVEAKSGDFNTVNGLTDEQRAEKTRREAEALRWLEAEFEDTEFEWVPRAVHEYNEQSTYEARMVRYLDKVLPKFTHILNQGRSLNMTRDEFLTARKNQLKELDILYPEQDQVRELFVLYTFETLTGDWWVDPDE